MNNWKIILTEFIKYFYSVILFIILVENYTPLNQDESEMLRLAGNILLSKAPIDCTGCRYCMDHGCPAGINIPKIIEALNMIQQYQDRRGANLSYFQAANALKNGADTCKQCGSCEQACPQHLPVMNLITQAEEEFSLDGVNVWANV